MLVRSSKSFLLISFLRIFIIFTDDQSPKCLMIQVIQAPEQQHCLSKVLGCVYAIEYRPCKHNRVADALSRKDTDNVSPKHENINEPQNWTLSTSALKNLKMYQLKLKNEIDAKLLTIHQQMQQGPLLDPYYFCINGILCCEGEVKLSSSTSLRNDLINLEEVMLGYIRHL